MKSVDIESVIGVPFTGGISYRSVLKKDNLGFALMKTVIQEGGPYLWHYKNHKEACYCISGWGEVKDLETGERIEVYPGITYLVDNHQKHEFTAYSDVVLISVFNPPLTGDETHDKEGNYITQ
jgi:L-ectoine synthase